MPYPLSTGIISRSNQGTRVARCEPQPIERETMATETKMMPWQLVVAYYGPTDTRGARHKVTSGDSGKNAKYFPYDYANPAHEVVCMQYMATLGYAPDLYRVDHVAAYIVNGRRHTFYSVTRLAVEL